LLKKTFSVLATISLATAGTFAISSPASSSPQVAVQKIGNNPPSPFNPNALQSSGASGHQLVSSADGTKMLMAQNRHFNNGNVADASDVLYRSEDSGLTWAALANSPIGEWAVVASSADGMKLAAASNGPNGVDGKIWVSSNGGLNWYPISGFQLSQYRNITLSNDGSRVILCDNDHGFKVSNVSIATATSADFNVNVPFSAQNAICGSLAASADGTISVT
jgi:hypothetical protein